MKGLEQWMEEQFSQRKVEPNSGLGEAIRYMRNHWEGLTLFLRAEGAPLGRVSDWRGNNTLRGVTVSRRCRCLSPRHVSRFQSLLIEPDVQISRFRLSRMRLRPSLSP